MKLQRVAPLVFAASALFASGALGAGSGSPSVLSSTSAFSLACFSAAEKNLGSTKDGGAAELGAIGMKRASEAAWELEDDSGVLSVGVIASRTTVSFTPSHPTKIDSQVLAGLAARAKRVTLSAADVLRYEMKVAPEGINAPKVRDVVSVNLNGEWVESSRWVVWGPLGEPRATKP